MRDDKQVIRHENEGTVEKRSLAGDFATTVLSGASAGAAGVLAAQATQALGKLTGNKPSEESKKE